MRGKSGRQRVRPARIEPERANFKALVLGNPNYFGTWPAVGTKAVKLMSQKTSYEQLTCIGLHPDAERLEAVVDIKRHFGYGGGPCTDGSTEFVRFFVKRATGWHDLGVATFTAHDLPASSTLPVSYSVELPMAELRQYCTVENVVQVRGILSWNWEPPAGDETWTPPWGNVLDVKVQIAPWSLSLVGIGTLVKDKLVTIDPSILATVKMDQPLPAAEGPAPSFAALKAKYKDEKVPGHRFGAAEIHELLRKPIAGSLFASLASARPAKKAKLKPALPAALLGGSDIVLEPNFSAILDDYFKTKGNRTFEELGCVGYNPETRMLSGVITIKRNSGYSGDLCEAGSLEYVAFWGFWGGTWHSLGTATVRVHDLAAVTGGTTVKYAVYRPSNLPEELCGDIQSMPLRAILSWAVPTSGPNDTPTWGNVVDTYVQPIITSTPVSDQRIRLMRINRVTISGIDGGGLAHPTGVAGDCNNANDSPFGGSILVEGDFTQKSDVYFDPANGSILPGQHPPAYQVFVSKVGSPAPPTQLTNTFGIAVFPVSPPPGTPVVVVNQAVQTLGGAQYYLYREGVVQAVNPRTLAVWEAGGLEEGAYDIEVRGFEWNGLAYVPLATPSQIERVYVYNGYPHLEQGVTVYRPQVELHITTPSGDCGDVVVGDTIGGTYSVTDHFFGSLGLGLVPITVGGVPQPINPVIPSGPTLYPAAGTGGTSGTWTLSTAGMTPCGYTIVLSAWDRALVSGSCSGHYNQVAVGFCLREPS